MAIELTEREIAIAQGQDPDAEIVDTGSQSEGSDTGDTQADSNPDSSIEDTGSQDGQDGSSASGSKDAASEPVVPDSGATGQKPPADDRSWLDETTKTLSKVYGMTDEDLAEFKSREDFDRTTRIIERRLLSSVQQNNGQEPAGKVTPPPTQPTTPETPPADPLAEFDPANWEGYDDKTKKMVQSHREALERLARVEQSSQEIVRLAQEADRKRYLDFFHDTTDGLEEGLFGRTLKEGKPAELNPEHNANRAKLWEAVHTLTAGIEARARETGAQPSMPPFKILLDRAAKLAFGDQLQKIERDRQTSKIREQSKLVRKVATHRTSSGSGRSPNGRFTQAAAGPQETVSALVENPQLKAMWDGFQDN
jgi:hypothetical protein